MRTVLVRTGEGGRDGKYEASADFEAKAILEAVRIIMEE